MVDLGLGPNEVDGFLARQLLLFLLVLSIYGHGPLRRLHLRCNSRQNSLLLQVVRSSYQEKEAEEESLSDLPLQLHLLGIHIAFAYTYILYLPDHGVDVLPPLKSVSRVLLFNCMAEDVGAVILI